MKILILANNSGGLYKFRGKLIEEIIKNKNKVFVIAPKTKFVDELINQGVTFIDIEIDRRGINPKNDLKLFFKYIKIIKDLSPDKVISYTIKPNIYGGIVARILNIDFYCNITGLGNIFNSSKIKKYIGIIMYKIALKKSKKVFFENTNNEDFFLKNKIISINKAVVLNGAGVDLEEHKFSELPIDNIIKFIFMSRIMKEKGVDELFYAIKKIKLEYKDKVEFYFLGSMEENYKEKIDYFHNQKYIKYYGSQKEVRTYIKEVHCCILPSYHEGMSNTLLECAAMGRALITTNINGCKEAVINGENGFLCSVKDENDLYKKIKKYIKLDFEEKKKMGQCSRKHIEKVFDKNKVVEKTINNLFY